MLIGRIHKYFSYHFSLYLAPLKIVLLLLLPNYRNQYTKSICNYIANTINLQELLPQIICFKSYYWTDTMVCRNVGVVVEHPSFVTKHAPYVVSVRRARSITTSKKTRFLIIVIPYTINHLIVQFLKSLSVDFSFFLLLFFNIVLPTIGLSPRSTRFIIFLILYFSHSFFTFLFFYLV